MVNESHWASWHGMAAESLNLYIELAYFRDSTVSLRKVNDDIKYQACLLALAACPLFGTAFFFSFRNRSLILLHRVLTKASVMYNELQVYSPQYVSYIYIILLIGERIFNSPSRFNS